ncbi:MAG: sterol desaturase family protein [Cytophagales bacterium]|nr:sterol desaturase family protein [Cytophagales bacterium]
MKLIIQFFERNDQLIQSTMFLSIFILCWSLEYFVGRVSETRNRRQFINNVFFSIFGAIVQLILGLVFLKSIQFEQENGLGLIHYWGVNSIFFKLLIAFIFLDFTYWLYHYFMHKIPVMWRFHAVHHSDSTLNVSTALREHPFETAIRLGHYILAVGIIGPPLWIISLHQFVQVVSKIIIHGNFRLPEKADRLFSFLFLTPNMHQVHHHYIRPYTDSNYGDLFSVWDRFFRTYRTLKKEELVFGLDQYPEGLESPEKWYVLLKRPFLTQNKL